MRLRVRSTSAWLAVVVVLAGTAELSADTAYVATAGNLLIRFDTATPSNISTLTVTGLQGGETLRGIDFRPANGQLYALGSTNRLYTINLVTGAATVVGAGPFGAALAGTFFGFDFNPVVDRIRVVSDAEENLRLHPDTGVLVATDTALTPVGTVIGATYSNNFAGATVTTLFGIDSGSDQLVRIGGPDGTPSPNGGAVAVIGPLGVDTDGLLGFDIGATGTAFAVFDPAGPATTTLYTINLATGAATPVGELALAPTNIVGLAVQLRPVITSVSPTAGSTLGGTTVTLAGSNLSNVTSVTFGGTAGTNLVVSSGTQLSVVAPAHAAGAVDVVATDSTSQTATLAGGFTYLAPPTNATTDTDSDGAVDACELQFGLDPLVADGTADADADGLTNTQECLAGTHPRGLFTRYLAEGATGAFFDTSFAVVNPGALPATVLMRFQRSNGTTASHLLPVAAMGRATFNAESLTELSSAEFSTVIESDVFVAADRTMTWDAEGYGSHTETFLVAPAMTWYLAEGATIEGFNLFYLVQNPNATAAEIEVTFLRPVPDPAVVRTYSVPANSRFNIWVNQIPELASAEISGVVRVTNGVNVVVERAMYLDAGGQLFGAGHESAGVTAPALNWFFAEGATGPFFDTFLLLANSNGTDAQVSVTYRKPDGSTTVKQYTVNANSRRTVWVDFEDVQLADTAVAMSVASTNAVTILAERAMWWPGSSTATWYEAHNSFGASAPGTRWAMAEGAQGGANSAETYILVVNTGATAGSVKATLLFEDGTTAERTYPLPGNSRLNVNVGADFPSASGKKFGAIIESLGTTPATIVVEGSFYASPDGVAFAAGSNALGTRVQ